MDSAAFKAAKKLEGVKFIYTFILGGLITFFWQYLNNYFSRKADEIKYEKTQATQIFEENSKLLGAVVINFRSFVQGKENTVGWHQAYFEWEENFTKNKALTDEYFGNPTSRLVIINDKINSLYNQFLDISAPKNGVNSDLETEVNNLDNDIYDFNSDLIKDLISNKIGHGKE